MEVALFGRFVAWQWPPFKPSVLFGCSCLVTTVQYVLSTTRPVCHTVTPLNLSDQFVAPPRSRWSGGRDAKMGMRWAWLLLYYRLGPPRGWHGVRRRVLAFKPPLAPPSTCTISLEQLTPCCPQEVPSSLCKHVHYCTLVHHFGLSQSQSLSFRRL